MRFDSSGSLYGAADPDAPPTVIAGDTTFQQAWVLVDQNGQMYFQDPNGLVNSTTDWQTPGTANGGGTLDTNGGKGDGGDGSSGSSDPNGDPGTDPTTDPGTDPGADPGTGDSGGDGGGDTGEPVVLDLTGNGINITQLGSSAKFVDMTGDGYRNRTAWAGAGNGVLMIDASGTGNVDTPTAFEFTLWDPTATSDMQALRDVFDTNHDGKLDAGDADFNEFRVLVTNADGTTTLETLAQLGITSIDLYSNNSVNTLPDGSQILGTTSYTRADGTTGTAADTSFAFEANGYAVTQTTTVNADGSTTIDVKAFNGDGSLANETISTTSADGLSRTVRFDHNGRGVFDQTQTDATVINADGSRTETLSNFDVAGVLTDRTATTTSADHATVSIARDLDGNGVVDQTELHVTDAAGTMTVTLSDLNPDGSLKYRTVTATSADGLTKSIQTDLNGDGTIDRTQTDIIVVNADGSRTETVSDLNPDGSLRDRTVTATSADNRSKTVQTDADGDGAFDLTQVSTIVVNADGSSVTTQQDLSRNGGLIDKTITSLSGDGLAKTTQYDADGNGTIDITTSDVTVRNADGSITETVTDTNADGSLRDHSTTLRGADGRSRTVQADTNGDGVVDHVETVVVGTDGSTVHTVSDNSADGALKDRTVTTTSANGLAVTTQYDITGDGTFELTQTDVIVFNPDGSRTETVIDRSANGALVDESLTTTSADGLTVTVQRDTTGAGVFNLTETDTKVVNADGSKTETVTDTYADGTLRDQSVITTSVDRLTVSVSTDANGDGHVTQTQTIARQATGAVAATVANYSFDGTLTSRAVTTTSADGLSITTQQDTTGAGVFNQTRTDVTVLNADGSRTETVTDVSANGSLRDRTITTTSANGLSIATQRDTTGAGSFDRTRTDVMALNADGSRTETVTDRSRNGALIDQIVTTTSGDGLSITTQVDATGDGVFDRTTTDVTVLNADGSRTETIADRSANGTLEDRTVTTVRADGITSTTSRDINGDGATDQTVATAMDAAGDKVTTISDYNGGALVDNAVVTTSANGLTTTIARSGGQHDSDVTVINADGSRTEAVTCLSGDGSLAYRIVATTSANGLSTTTSWDATGAGSSNLTKTDTTVFNANGSEVETVSFTGSITETTVTTTSADRKSIVMQRDLNGMRTDGPCRSGRGGRLPRVRSEPPPNLLCGFCYWLVPDKRGRESSRSEAAIGDLCIRGWRG